MCSVPRCAATARAWVPGWFTSARGTLQVTGPLALSASLTSQFSPRIDVLLASDVATSWGPLTLTSGLGLALELP